MIINNPTGLYKSLFGWEPAISNQDYVYNISWYISSNDPPTIRDNFAQITNNAVSTLLPQRMHTLRSRRNTYGQLIFTVDDSSYSQLGSSKKQFEEGQILDFNDVQSITLVVPSVGKVDIRHNNNILDVKSYLPDNLDDSWDDLSVEAADKLRTLSDQYTQARSLVLDLEIEIKELQKSINEVNKAIASVHIIDPGGPIETQLILKNQEYNIIIVNKQSEYNAQVIIAENIKDQIKILSQIVR
jgi:hypothetical protein